MAPRNITGYSALWRIIPARGIGVAVIVNREGPRLDRIVEAALANAARNAGRPLIEPSIRPAAAAPSGVTPPSGEALRALDGTYEARFPLELRWRDGRLRLVRFGDTLGVTSLGGNRYSVKSAGAATSDVFTIVPARGEWPAYIQMFLWAFPRVRD